MDKSRRIILLIGSLALLIVIALGVTYAAFGARVTGLESASVLSMEGGELWINIDGGPDIVANALIPDNDNPWVTKTITVTGKNNTADLTMSYTINFVIDNNTFVTTPMLYTLESTNNSNNGLVIPSVTELTPITGTITLGGGYFTTGNNLTHTYVLKVYFPDTGVDQSADMNALYAAHIGVEGGRAYNFIEIQNIEDLLDLSDRVYNGEDYKDGTEFLLMRDLDFESTSSYEDSTRTDYGDINGNGTTESLITELTTGKGFIPIGKDASFDYSFNGNNHTISNLYISRNDYTNLGLFSYVKDSTIKNLTVTGDVTTDLLSAHSGGLVGLAEGDITIDNVKTYVDVENSNSDYNTRATGGIIGAITDGDVNVNNCENHGSVQATYSAGAGIIGGGVNENSIVTITNTKNYGDVYGGMSAGGMVSDSYWLSAITVNNCENHGDVGSWGLAGGVMGVISGTVTADINNLINTGNISSTANSVGAAIGKCEQTSVSIIKNVVNSGNMTTNDLHAGGILGWNSDSAVVIIDNSSNSGTINAAGYGGGIIGCTSTTSSVGKSYILNTYNSGNYSSQTGCAGGMVGGSAVTDYNLVVINSYNTGTGSAATSNRYASGIIGWIQATNTLIIDNVYNYGSMTGSGGKYGITYFKNTVTYTMNNTFYLSGITGSNKSGTTSKTAAEFAGDALLNTSVTYLLNSRINNINLSSTDSLLANYTLNTWKLDSVHGYPVFNN